MGRGTFVGADFLGGAIPEDSNGLVEENVIRNMVIGEIGAQRTGAPNGNSLYMIYLPPGVRTQISADPRVGGYHFNFSLPTGPTTGQDVCYGVIPFPGYALDSLNILQTMTVFASHELFVAVTNERLNLGAGISPNGIGWWDSNPGDSA